MTQSGSSRERKIDVIVDITRIAAVDELATEPLWYSQPGHDDVVFCTCPVSQLHPPLRIVRLCVVRHGSQFGVPPPHCCFVGRPMAQACLRAQEEAKAIVEDRPSAPVV